MQKPSTMKNINPYTCFAFWACFLFPLCIFAQWERAGGPEKTNTRQVCLHRKHFFAIDESGLYRLPVNGSAWQQIGQNLSSQDNKIQIVGVLAGRSAIFADVGDYNGRYRTYYRSTDLGESWVALDRSMGLVVRKIDQILVFGDTVLARVRLAASPLQPQVYYSHNGGKDWQKAQHGTFLPQDTWVRPVRIGGRILIVNSRNNLIFESRDGGANWVSFAPRGVQFNYPYVDFVGLGNTLFMPFGSPSLIHLSKDFGRNWEPLFVPDTEEAYTISSQNGYLKAGFLNSSFEYSEWVSADTGKTWYQPSLPPTLMGETFIYVGGAEVASSQNQGKDWSVPHTFLPPSAGYIQFEAGFNPYVSKLLKKDTAALALAGGLAYSLNAGKTWFLVDQGLKPNRSLGSGKLLRIGNNILSQGVGLFRSTNQGANWEESPYEGLKTSRLAEIHELNGKLYGTDGIYGYVSVDEGLSWDSIAAPSQDYIYKFIPIGNKLFVNQVNNQGIGEFFYSDDLTGKNWQPLSLPEGVFFAELSGNQQSLFLYDYQQTWQSKDYGKSWTLLPINFNSITSTNKYELGLLGGLSGRAELYLSKDGGENWQNIIDSVGLVGRDIVSMAVQEEQIFVVLSTYWEDAVHYSPNLGKDWYDITHNLPDFYPLNLGDLDVTPPNDIRSLLIKDGYLYAATFGGIYRIPLARVPELCRPGPELRQAESTRPKLNYPRLAPPSLLPQNPAQRKLDFMRSRMREKTEGTGAAAQH